MFSQPHSIGSMRTRSEAIPGFGHKMRKKRIFDRQHIVLPPNPFFAGPNTYPYIPAPHPFLSRISPINTTPQTKKPHEKTHINPNSGRSRRVEKSPSARVADPCYFVLFVSFCKPSSDFGIKTRKAMPWAPRTHPLL